MSEPHIQCVLKSRRECVCGPSINGRKNLQHACRFRQLHVQNDACWKMKRSTPTHCHTKWMNALTRHPEVYHIHSPSLLTSGQYDRAIRLVSQWLCYIQNSFTLEVKGNLRDPCIECTWWAMYSTVLYIKLLTRLFKPGVLPNILNYCTVVRKIHNIDANDN